MKAAPHSPFRQQTSEKGPENPWILVEMNRPSIGKQLEVNILIFLDILVIKYLVCIIAGAEQTVY